MQVNGAKIAENALKLCSITAEVERCDHCVGGFAMEDHHLRTQQQDDDPRDTTRLHVPEDHCITKQFRHQLNGDQLARSWTSKHSCARRWWERRARASTGAQTSCTSSTHLDTRKSWCEVTVHSRSCQSLKRAHVDAKQSAGGPQSIEEIQPRNAQPTGVLEQGNHHLGCPSACETYSDALFSSEFTPYHWLL